MDGMMMFRVGRAGEWQRMIAANTIGVIRDRIIGTGALSPAAMADAQRKHTHFRAARRTRRCRFPNRIITYADAANAPRHYAARA